MTQAEPFVPEPPGRMVEPAASSVPAFRTRLQCPERSGDRSWARLEVFEDKAEFDAWWAESGEGPGSAQPLDLADPSSGSITSWCPACRRETRMSFSAGHPNFREQMTCSDCRLNARNRAMIDLLERLLVRLDSPSIYLTEQVSPLYRWLKARCPDVLGSEYVGERRSARLIAWLRQLCLRRERLNLADVTALNLATDSRDVLICCDVLEHVPDYPAALGEFARVLRPGGWLLLTVPFMADTGQTVVRARIDADGRLEHLLSPEYHADTTSSQGVLAYYNFGWDLLERLRAAGFERAAWCLSRAPALGLPAGMWTLLAQR